MMSLWDALRMNMMISYQELVRTFPRDVVKGKLIDVFCGFDSKCLSKQVTISTKDDLRLIDAKVINDQSIKNRFKQYHLKE